MDITSAIVQNDESKNFSLHFGNHLVVRMKIQLVFCERRIAVSVHFFVRQAWTVFAVFQKARKIAKTFGNPYGWLTSLKKYDKLILVRGTISRSEVREAVVKSA